MRARRRIHANRANPRWPLALFGLVVLVGACAEPTDDLVLLGTVERTFVEITSPVAQVISSVAVERGQRVAAGAAVAELDPTLAAADLAGADAVLARARAAFSMAEEEAARSRKLRKDRILSKQELDRAELALEEAAARVREAEARREAALKRLRDHSLEAPDAGTIDQIPFEPGERVPSGAVLAVITLDKAPWVRVFVPEHAIARIARGARARVDVDGLGEMQGRVTEIAREPEYTPHFSLTERERAYLVFEGRVEIEDAPASLRAGMPAEVHLALDQAAAPGPPADP